MGQCTGLPKVPRSRSPINQSVHEAPLNPCSPFPLGEGAGGRGYCDLRIAVFLSPFPRRSRSRDISTVVNRTAPFGTGPVFPPPFALGEGAGGRGYSPSPFGRGGWGVRVLGPGGEVSALKKNRRTDVRRFSYVPLCSRHYFSSSIFWDRVEVPAPILAMYTPLATPRPWLSLASH